MIQRLLLLGACLVCLAMPAYSADAPAANEQEITTIGSMPVRGMTMEQVEQFFGAPLQKSGPVGQPPISRWIYEGFTVYFEGQRVIHALATPENSN